MTFEILDEQALKNIVEENKRLQAELELIKKKNEEQNLEIVKMMVEIEEDNNKLTALNRKVKENFKRIIKLIQRIIELREPGYFEHTQRLMKIASYIARKIALEPRELDCLVLAVFVHEVGKIALPDQVVQGRDVELSDEEIKLLNQQSVIGAQLLEKEEGFEKVAKILRHLNEYVDGSGLPDGLIGHQIPRGSKILLVADTFDSLIYKKKNLMTVKQALDYIDLHKGKKFDEIVVSYLHHYVRDRKLIKGIPAEIAISHRELVRDMVLSRDLYTSSNLLLAAKGSVLTDESIARIKLLNAKDPIQGSIYIYTNSSTKN